jgi:hypothetical protein
VSDFVLMVFMVVSFYLYSGWFRLLRRSASSLLIGLSWQTRWPFQWREGHSLSGQRRPKRGDSTRCRALW